jgi:exopolysaccharide biosynthesis predicted pyruvyltransferase EpsI
MAFNLNAKKLMDFRVPALAEVLFKKIYWKLTGNPRIKEVPSPRMLIKSKIAEIKSFLYSTPHQTRKLYCFRNDAEKTSIPLPKANLDISRIYKQEIGYLPLIYYSACKMTRLINKYDAIYTNRLHAGIIGALLGKKTYLYPNSYYKNQAVYEHSLKDHYPSVCWMGQ